jgi:uncharacterized protein (DUF1499 family)
VHPHSLHWRRVYPPASPRTIIRRCASPDNLYDYAAGKTTPAGAPNHIMRRLILEEPVSAAAVWSRRLASFSIAVALISILLARSGVVDMTAVLAVFGAAILIACLAVLFACAAAVIIWRVGRRGAGIVAASLFLSAIVLALPGYYTAQAVRLPLLNDVSTDLNEPPDFSRSPRAIAARGNVDHASIPMDSRDGQRRAYPEIQPIVLDLDVDEAWPLILKAVDSRKWRVVEQTKPGGRIGIGHIDAVDRTLVMGFPDDVTVRVRPLAGQTRIDVRSASRYGRHDFGANAKRIKAFSDELQAQLDAR